MNSIEGKDQNSPIIITSGQKKSFFPISGYYKVIFK